jgi:hypothetical protein
MAQRAASSAVCDDKTPIEIQLMNDLAFVIDLNENKTNEIIKLKRIIKEQKTILKLYADKIIDQRFKIKALETSNTFLKK